MTAPPAYGSIPRKEDARLIRGQGTFVDDLSLPASASPDPAPYASSPHWQEMIRRVVTDWYVGHNTPVGLLG